LRRRQSVPLSASDEASEWLGSLSIGTPPRKFVVNFDTGSADLWIPSDKCTDDACESKNKYSASKSSTSVAMEGSLDITYGDGSGVNGPIWADTVDVGGLKAHNQSFAAVGELSDMFTSISLDGIVGMGYPQLSMMGALPFFNTMAKQGVVSEKVFSFKIADEGSSLFLGGTDGDLYTGDIEYHKVDTLLGYWMTSGGQISVGDKPA
ncbi:hypothetical protein M422DRAFT_98668, partial [Sphaerobolus stellatus SS14]